VLETIKESQSSLDSGANSGEVGKIMNQAVAVVLSERGIAEEEPAFTSPKEAVGAKGKPAGLAQEYIIPVSEASSAAGSVTDHPTTMSTLSAHRSTWDSATSTKSPCDAVALHMPASAPGDATVANTGPEQSSNQYCCSKCRPIAKVGRVMC
jgi:hypothetical protein